MEASRPTYSQPVFFLDFRNHLPNAGHVRHEELYQTLQSRVTKIAVLWQRKCFIHNSGALHCNRKLVGRE